MYVVALTDCARLRLVVGGRRYGGIRAGELCAFGERRTTRPPASDEELRHQHRVVTTIRNRCPAVLPVRFGALMEIEAVRDLLWDRAAPLQRALDQVRDRWQFTIRVHRRAAPLERPAATTGREYLARRREVLAPSLPAEVSRFLESLRRLVALEQRAAANGPFIATVHHLVDEVAIDSYVSVSRDHPSTVSVNGPWPPFAFTPELL